jgi:hypothetical protein
MAFPMLALCREIFSCIKPGELPINAGEYVAFVMSRKIVNGCDAVTIPRIAPKKQSRENPIC